MVRNILKAIAWIVVIAIAAQVFMAVREARHPRSAWVGPSYDPNTFHPSPAPLPPDMFKAPPFKTYKQEK